MYRWLFGFCRKTHCSTMPSAASFPPEVSTSMVVVSRLEMLLLLLALFLAVTKAEGLLTPTTLQQQHQLHLQHRRNSPTGRPHFRHPQPHQPQRLPQLQSVWSLAASDAKNNNNNHNNTEPSPSPATTIAYNSTDFQTFHDSDDTDTDTDTDIDIDTMVAVNRDANDINGDTTTATTQSHPSVTAINGIKSGNPCPQQQQPEQQQQQRRQMALFACAIAATAGFGEVCSLRTYGCFINMCTGSTIRIVVALAEGSRSIHDLALPTAVLVGYISGIALARFAHYTVSQWQQHPHPQHPQQQRTLNNVSITSRIKAHRSSRRRFRRLAQAWMRNCLYWPNHNAQSRRPTPLVVLRAVTPLVVVLFGMADVLSLPAIVRFLYYTMGSSTTGSTTMAPPLALCALIQATGYGLVHQTASDAVGGAVLFVLTGYYAALSRAAVDWVMVTKDYETTTVPLVNGKDDRVESGTMNNSSLPLPMALKQGAVATMQNQIQVLGSFIAGVLVAVWVWNRVVLGTTTTATAESVIFPGKHSITGLLFAALFVWYGGQSSSLPPTAAAKTPATTTTTPP